MKVEKLKMEKYLNEYQWLGIAIGVHFACWAIFVPVTTRKSKIIEERDRIAYESRQVEIHDQMTRMKTAKEE